jgi:hypothetical protein
MVRLLKLGAIIAALIIVGGSAFVWASAEYAARENVRRASDAAHEYKQHADGEANDRCRLIAASEQAECRYSIYHSAHEAGLREREVEADENNAVWVKAAGRAAILGIIFTLLSLFLLWANFAEQRITNRQSRADAKDAAASAGKSLAAANKAAKAAAAQVEIAQDTAYRDLRAYLSIVVEGDKPSKSILSGTVIIRNAGQTPAGIKLFINTWIGPWPTEDPHTKGPPLLEDPHHQPYINRGCEERVAWFYPWAGDAQDEIGKLFGERSEKVALMVYGRVEFIDFMKRERVLNFSYRDNGFVEMGKPIEMVPTPKGNEYEDRSGYEA